MMHLVSKLSSRRTVHCVGEVSQGEVSCRQSQSEATQYSWIAVGVHYFTMKPSAVDQFERHDIIRPKVHCESPPPSATTSEVCSMSG